MSPSSVLPSDRIRHMQAKSTATTTAAVTSETVEEGGSGSGNPNQSLLDAMAKLSLELESASSSRSSSPALLLLDESEVVEEEPRKQQDDDGDTESGGSVRLHRRHLLEEDGGREKEPPAPAPAPAPAAAVGAPVVESAPEPPPKDLRGGEEEDDGTTELEDHRGRPPELEEEPEEDEKSSSLAASVDDRTAAVGTEVEEEEEKERRRRARRVEDILRRSNEDRSTPGEGGFVAALEMKRKRSVAFKDGGRGREWLPSSEQDEVSVPLSPRSSFRPGRRHPHRSILKKANSMPSPVTGESIEAESSCPERAVSFDTVTIREYPMTLGDHPNCSFGPPVTLGWDYDEYESMELDSYENRRPRRRTLRGMMLNYYKRKNVLLHWAGHTEEELKEATARSNHVKKQRSRTTMFMPALMAQEATIGAVRKMKKKVLRKKKKNGWAESYNRGSSSGGSGHNV